MKKWIALFAVVGLVCVAWWVARQQRMGLGIHQAKVVKMDRGDVHVPITAPGRIEPIRRFEVKSKAGGEIIAIHVKEGDYVQTDQILVELDPEDEERIKDRAEADRDIAKLQVKTAENNVKDAGFAIASLEAQLDSLKAQSRRVAAELNQAKKDKEGNVYSPLDLIMKQSAFDTNEADQANQLARIGQAKQKEKAAAIAVDLQKQNLVKFERLFDDAKERLAETTIKAPRDGIVTEVPVSIGAKIQSGVSSMTGGTVLLRLADVSTMEVLARVDEADWGKIADIAPVDALPDVPGNRDAARRNAELLARRSGRVKIEVDAFPDEIFEGMIVRVEPQGRAGSATVIQFSVHVEITDPQRNKLPLGAQAQVTFTVESAINALRVTVDAVKSLAGKPGVWIPAPPAPGQQGKGKKFIPCSFTISDGEFVVVEQADSAELQLREGQAVYTRLPPDPNRDDG